MSTPKQIAANRDNAKKSTGPKTEEGKRRSSKNAIKHGLRSEDFLTRHEDSIAFSLFRHQLFQDHNPQTAVEVMLVEQVLHSYFLSRRFATSMVDAQWAGEQGGKSVLETYPILMKLKNQADRTMVRAIEQLRLLQAARPVTATEPEPIWPEVEPDFNPRNPHDLHDLGFVSPNFYPLAPRTLNKPEDPPEKAA